MKKPATRNHPIVCCPHGKNASCSFRQGKWETWLGRLLNCALCGHRTPGVQVLYVRRIQGRACVVSTKEFGSKNERGLYLFMFCCLANVVLRWRLWLKIAMVCIHTYAHTLTYAHKHARIYVYIYKYTYKIQIYIQNTYLYVCVYIYMYIYMYIYIYVCI